MTQDESRELSDAIFARLATPGPRATPAPAPALSGWLMREAWHEFARRPGPPEPLSSSGDPINDFTRMKMREVGFCFELFGLGIPDGAPRWETGQPLWNIARRLRNRAEREAELSPRNLWYMLNRDVRHLRWLRAGGRRRGAPPPDPVWLAEAWTRYAQSSADDYRFGMQVAGRLVAQIKALGYAHDSCDPRPGGAP